MSINELLKPEIVNSISGLELIARVIVEGFISGNNKSQTVGSGQVFSQYRRYEPGDDLRQFDWKVYARTEKYFIRQAEVEANIAVKFVIDASHSMAYSEEGVTKLQYASVIAASLAYLSRKQSDALGLFLVNDEEVDILAPRFEQQQFMRFLQRLVKAKPAGKWKKNGMDQIAYNRGKELIIFISDLYDDHGDLPGFISKLKTRRNEVIVFHLLGKREIELGFEGTFTFKDLEDGATLSVDTRAERKQYAGRIESWHKRSRQNFLEKNIHYHAISMGDNLSQVLRDFLKVRCNFRS